MKCGLCGKILKNKNEFLFDEENFKLAKEKHLRYCSALRKNLKVRSGKYTKELIEAEKAVLIEIDKN